MSIADHPAYKQAYTEMQAEIARTVPPMSEVMHRWEAERTLMRRDPELAKLYRAEAIADNRAECHVSEAAKLPAIRDLLREIIEAHTGRAFKNPLFP